MWKAAVIVCVFAGAILSSGADAATWSAAKATWVKVDTNPPFTTYADTASVRVRGKVRDVWDKTVEAVTDPGRVEVTLTRWRFNCVKRQGTMLFSEGFLKSGAAFGSRAIPESERVWDDVLPGTTAEALMKFACAR